MNFYNINTKIEQTLTEHNLPLPERGNHETEIQRTENLFLAVEKTAQNTEDPQILAELRQLLETTDQESIEGDPRLRQVFHNCMRHIKEKLPNPGVDRIVSNSIATTAMLRTASDSEIAETLGLNDWGSSGDIEEAKRRIIICFKNSSPDLSLYNLGLTSPPPTRCFSFLSDHLRSLNMAENFLTQIDLSNLSKLNNLILRKNQFTQIDLSNLSNLTHLYLSENQLRQINLPNPSKLTHLYLSENRLTQIDLTGLTNLIQLNLNNNQIREIDLSKLTKLNWMDLDSNQIREIDLSNLTKLEVVFLSNNRLTQIDVFNLNNIKHLYLNNNQLTEIDLSNLTELGWVFLSNNRLTQINIPRENNLMMLDLSYNQLEREPTLSSPIEITKYTGNPFTQRTGPILPESSFLLRTASDSEIAETLGLNDWGGSGNIEEAKRRIIICFKNSSPDLDLHALGLTSPPPTRCFSFLSDHLRSLNMGENFLTQIDLSNLSKLNNLILRKNQFTQIDLSNLSNLTHLSLSENRLTQIDLTSLTNLIQLNLDSNQIREIDLSKLTKLNWMDLDSNQIREINLSNLTDLTYVYLLKNQLTHITLSNLPKLTHLNLDSNQLEQLDLSNLSNLTDLTVSNNQLREMNLSHLSRLNNLILSYNQLREIHLPGGNNLIMLDISYNRLQREPTLSSPIEIMSYTGNPFMEGTGQNLSESSFLVFKQKLPKDSPLQGLSLNNIREKQPGLYNKIQLFFQKLLSSNSFKESRKKEAEQFAEEVFLCIEMAINDLEFQSTFEILLDEALGSCVDRVAFYQNMLHTGRSTYKIPTLSHKEALLLIKGIYILDILNRYAHEYILSRRRPFNGNTDNMRDVVETRDGVPYVEGIDVVEVFLDLQVHFQEKYSLPISAKTKNYLSSLTEENRKEAERTIIEGMNEEKFITYCLNMPLWKKRIETEKTGELVPVSEALGEEMEELTGSTRFSEFSESERKAAADSLQQQYEQTRSEILRQATRGLIRENDILTPNRKGISPAPK